MTLINQKAKGVILTEEEEYKARNHIFSEYIVLNNYESIKRQMGQDEAYQSKIKQARKPDIPKPKYDASEAKSPVSPNQELSEVIDNEDPDERAFAEGKKYLASLDKHKIDRNI